jgi:hypothetical protein
MDKEKVQVESGHGQSLFGSSGQVTEVQAGSMSITVGVSERLTQDTGDPLDECTFPDVPLGADSEYDTWLG